MSDTIDTSVENDTVRRIIEWFLTYYESSDEGKPSHVLEWIGVQFRGDADEADMERAYEVLHDRSARWAPRPEWKARRRPPATCGARLVACALPAGHEGPHSRIDKPPPFIVLKGVEGYVRADRIETVTVDSCLPGTLVSMFNGTKFLSEETPDEVFAKMADALRINTGEPGDDE